MNILIDTSVLVAAEHGDAMQVPSSGHYCVSVITLAELHVGVLGARTDAIRGQRLETLVRAEQHLAPLEVDGLIARRFAKLVTTCRARGESPQVFDALIAATALVHDLPLLTRDRGFEVFDGLDLRLV